MRRLLALALMTLGCGAPPGGLPIALRFSSPAGAPPVVGTGYSAGVGSAKVANGTITLESRSGDIDLLLMVDVPPYPATIAVGDHCLQVNYTEMSAGKAWGSSVPVNGAPGTVTFATAASPYKISLQHLLMVPATPGTSGTFDIDGTGEFSE